MGAAVHRKRSLLCAADKRQQGDESPTQSGRRQKPPASRIASGTDTLVIEAKPSPGRHDREEGATTSGGFVTTLGAPPIRQDPVRRTLFFFVVPATEPAHLAVGEDELPAQERLIPGDTYFNNDAHPHSSAYCRRCSYPSCSPWR